MDSKIDTEHVNNPIYVETGLSNETVNSALIENRNEDTDDKTQLKEKMEAIWEREGTKKNFKQIERICKRISKEYGMIHSIR